MENHIKSEDLCWRRIYAFDRHCREKMQGSCDGCVMNGTLFRKLDNDFCSYGERKEGAN